MYQHVSRYKKRNAFEILHPTTFMQVRSVKGPGRPPKGGLWRSLGYHQHNHRTALIRRRQSSALYEHRLLQRFYGHETLRLLLQAITSGRSILHSLQASFCAGRRAEEEAGQQSFASSRARLPFQKSQAIHSPGVTASCRASSRLAP
jgi:hypothetical protein